MTPIWFTPRTILPIMFGKVCRLCGHQLQVLVANPTVWRSQWIKSDGDALRVSLLLGRCLARLISTVPGVTSSKTLSHPLSDSRDSVSEQHHHGHAHVHHDQAHVHHDRASKQVLILVEERLHIWSPETPALFVPWK